MCSVFAWLGLDPPMFNLSKLKDKGWQKSRNHTTLDNTLQNHNSIFELLIKIYEKELKKSRICMCTYKMVSKLKRDQSSLSFPFQFPQILHHHHNMHFELTSE